MKKILFSLCFFTLMVAGAQAQKASCAKTCTKSAAATAACHEKSPSAASTASTGTVSAAQLASMDATIETRTDAATGNVSYVRKQTCSHSGTVSYVDVSYDASTNTFVNVAPSKAAGKGAGCSSKSANAGGKACCASGVAMGKSCCAGKAASTKSAEKVKS